jgi:hypothetical protein
VIVLSAGGLAVPALALPAIAGPAPAGSAGSADRAGSGGLSFDHRPTAAVSLGDSYISGEAGRWKGNATTAAPGRLGTDRAWRSDPANPAGVIDRSLVYGDTVANGCHRSDVAPIESAWLLVSKSINLACSGAKTVNVLRASAGGVGFKGELPQDDQLATVAANNRVQLIVLSIGGNDLHFGDILSSCVAAYLTSTTPCSTTQQGAIDAALPRVAAAVGATVDDIRATMASAGYRSWDYRLIIQSYPAPTPAAGNNRYSGTSPDQRATVGSCPLLDVDSAWAHSTLVPALSGALASVAQSHDAQFLDLTDAFHGHELCAATAEQSTGKPSSATSEWIRFIDLAGQGDSAESLHPNYYGQLALGHCLTLAALTRHDVACHALPKLPDWAVHLAGGTSRAGR